jgi:hypothetical protein
VARREQEQQGKEEEITAKLTCEHNELESHVINLSAREATLVMKWEHMWKTREDLYNHEFTMSS